MSLKCEHCDASLKPEKSEKRSSGLFKCPKCKCLFGIVIIRNDAECFEKRRQKK